MFFGLLFSTPAFRCTRVSAAFALFYSRACLSGWKDAANRLRIAVLRGAGDDSGKKVTISLLLLPLVFCLYDDRDRDRV